MALKLKVLTSILGLFVFGIPIAMFFSATLSDQPVVTLKLNERPECAKDRNKPIFVGVRSDTEYVVDGETLSKSDMFLEVQKQADGCLAASLILLGTGHTTQEFVQNLQQDFVARGYTATMASTVTKTREQK